MGFWPQAIRSSFCLAFCKVRNDQPGTEDLMAQCDGALESLVTDLGAIPEEFYYH